MALPPPPLHRRQGKLPCNRCCGTEELFLHTPAGKRRCRRRPGQRRSRSHVQGLPRELLLLAVPVQLDDRSEATRRTNRQIGRRWTSPPLQEDASTSRYRSVPHSSRHKGAAWHQQLEARKRPSCVLLMPVVVALRCRPSRGRRMQGRSRSGRGGWACVHKEKYKFCMHLVHVSSVHSSVSRRR